MFESAGRWMDEVRLRNSSLRAGLASARDSSAVEFVVEIRLRREIRLWGIRLCLRMEMRNAPAGHNAYSRPRNVCADSLNIVFQCDPSVPCRRVVFKSRGSWQDSTQLAGDQRCKSSWFGCKLCKTVSEDMLSIEIWQCP